MRKKVSLISDICQLCYEKIPVKLQQKHLLDYHRLHMKAVNKTEPLHYWFGTKAPVEVIQEELSIENKVLLK